MKISAIGRWRDEAETISYLPNTPLRSDGRDAA
jgi:hypothetical protein